MEAYSGVFNGARASWTWVLYNFFFFFLSLIVSYLIFYKSSFTLKLDFEKIELWKRSISLISLENGTKCWFFCMKKAFAHFLSQPSVYINFSTHIDVFLKIKNKKSTHIDASTWTTTEFPSNFFLILEIMALVCFSSM